MTEQLLLPGTPEGYRTILADPPWEERGGGQCCRGAQRHYPVLPVDSIARVMRESGRLLPHAEGCHLWMWATSNHLEDALWLIRELGFRYVTSSVWVKIGANGLPQIGLGQYLRHGHEWLLLAVRGSLPLPSTESRPQSVIFAPRGRHSAKPEAQYALIEAVSPGPRLEMFARERRDGWDSWGNEVPS